MPQVLKVVQLGGYVFKLLLQLIMFILSTAETVFTYMPLHELIVLLCTSTWLQLKLQLIFSRLNPSHYYRR